MAERDGAILIGIGLAETVGLLLLLWWGKSQWFFFGSGRRKQNFILFFDNTLQGQVVLEMAHTKSLF